MQRAFNALLMFGVSILILAGGQARAAEPEHADVRVLIDISGSMKQNDPQNLRRPALRMLVGLLQPGTKAGVWTFAKYAGELVPPAAVDQAWKDVALKASEEISSPGMFTNIELVLERAMHDWEGARPTHRRHLLLLTDGVVDVSKAPGESEASRRRILETLLPRLRAMDARVHTIALSARADHALLKQLAAETDGWYEQVDSAEQLQRVFLKLFEKAGKPDGLPLKDNRFLVDNTIREATILLFRPEDSAEPALHAPSGQVFRREQAPAFISWHHDTGYELITLRDPEAGEWSLTAEVDPDNRVMVVTDLKLRVSELPSRIAAGEALAVAATLTNNGHPIKRRDFMDLVEMHAETAGEQGLAPQPLNDKGYKGDTVALDGEYGMQLVERAAESEVNLLIAAQSPTFTRETRHLFAVVEPATLEVAAQDGAMTATLTMDDSVMAREGVKAVLWQQGPDGIRMPLEATLTESGAWRAELVESAWPVYGQVKGTTRLGNALLRELGPVHAPGMAPSSVQSGPEPAVATAAPDEQAAGDGQPRQPEMAEDENGWLLPLLGFGLVNLLLIIGGLVYWWLRRGARSDEEVMLLDEEAPVPDAEQVSEGEAA